MGQAVISDRDISQRLRSLSTSIHILDDESLLHIFYLYRPADTVTDEDEFFDDIHIRGRWDSEHWWYKPAQVCRRWRNLILGSPSFLGLCLVCTLGTPIADMLAHSPPLPLVINYLDGGRNMTAEDKEGIFLALEQPYRIRCINVALPLQDLQKFVMAIDVELPNLEYLVMMSGRGREDGATFVFPETIQAPRPRFLVLACVVPPIGSRFLTTALGLVTLYLFMDDSTYLNPNSLLQWISSLPQLERLVISIYPECDVETQLSHTPTITHATLPSLRFLSFQGYSTYLEILICQIATPRLDKLHILFYVQLTFSIPCLVRFMNTTESKRLRFDNANLEFSGERVVVGTYPQNRHRRCFFNITIRLLSLNDQFFSMAQIVDALGQVFSVVDHLILDYVEDGQSCEHDFDLDVDRRTEWHKLLRPFKNVKSLRVYHGLVEELSRSILMEDGELPPGLLPELQELTCFGRSNAGDAFTSFINARRDAGRPVSLVHRSPSPSNSG